jgi:hypothetical protein
VAIISLFVGKYGRRWKEDEVGRALASLERAAAWLAQESVRWGVDLDLQLLDTYFEEQDNGGDEVEIQVTSEPHQMGLFEGHALEKAMASASEATARLGFAGVADWIDQAERRIAADHCVWLIQPRAAGRSHALPEKRLGPLPEIVSLIPGVALAVCYPQQAEFPCPPTGSVGGESITIAHELLHLFGARDKYQVPLSDFPAATVTESDIMRLAQPSLSRFRVDPLTAFEVGWSESGRALSSGAK